MDGRVIGAPYRAGARSSNSRFGPGTAVHCWRAGFVDDAAHFEFDTALVDEDRDAENEHRFGAIGFIGDRLCFLVFTEHDDEVRAISLRSATAKERRRYHEPED